MANEDLRPCHNPPAGEAGDELVSKGRHGGELKPARGLPPSQDRDSRRIAAYAEEHLPSVVVVESRDGQMREIENGKVVVRAAIIKIVKIGDGDDEAWYEVAYPVDTGKSGTMTADEVIFSQLEKLLALPGRRAELLALIQSRGRRIS